MELGLSGKRAVVTGASKGIGFAIACALAREGCHLDLAARDPTGLEEAREQLHRASPDIDIGLHPADLARPEDQQRLAENCAAADILVNNAGSAPAGHLDETSDAVWRTAFDLKVFGYVNLARAFYAAMKERRDGVILNIIGYAGERLNARYIVGTTANAGLMAFTRSAGSKAPDFGVRVVGVNPGYTATDRAEKQLRVFSEQRFGTPERWRDAERDLNLPFGRMARPAEIADVVAFLVSPRASYVSGTIVTVDGGATHRNF